MLYRLQLYMYVCTYFQYASIGTLLTPLEALHSLIGFYRGIISIVLLRKSAWHVISCTQQVTPMRSHNRSFNTCMPIHGHRVAFINSFQILRVLRRAASMFLLAHDACISMCLQTFSFFSPCEPTSSKRTSSQQSDKQCSDLAWGRSPTPRRLDNYGSWALEPTGPQCVPTIETVI